MTIADRMRQLAHAYEFYLTAGYNFLTVDSKGRIEGWFTAPKPSKLFGHWVQEDGSDGHILDELNLSVPLHNLLVSQWKSCIIAVNEIEEKPSHDAPLSGLIAVAAMLDHHPDAWL